MNKKYLLESSLKVARFSRLMAKAIDLFIVVVVSIIFYPLGVIISIGYMTVADALQNGQSVGKKMIGFQVMSLEDGSPCSIRQSFVRNLPIIVPLFFAMIPFWGWFFTLLLGLPFIGLEIYLIYKLDSGHRLGDVMADTTVMANDDTLAQIKNRKTSWFENIAEKN